MPQPPLKNGCFSESLICAIRGIAQGVKEKNFRIHFLAFFLALFMGVYFKITLTQWALVFVVSGIVIVSEMVNTVLEEVCDKLRDDLGLSYYATQKARDISAGAVLFAAFVAVIIGLFIFLPHVVSFLTSIFQV